jgi:beta-lactamase regulating signal transducer with metallopeptidase domain
MNQLVEYSLWCMVQVTLFAVAAVVAYWFLRRQPAKRNANLLAASFGVIALLTFACVSPWPRWEFGTFWATGEAPQQAAYPVVVELPNPDGTLFDEPGFAAIDNAAPMESTLTSTNPAEAKMVYLELANDRDGAYARWLVLAAWIAVAIGATRFAYGYVCAKRLRTESTSIDDDVLRSEFDRLRTAMDCSRAVDLRESPTLNVAATLGWRRPVVLLPAAWRDWSPDERRAVFAHELAHVAERHFPAWIASQLTTVVHFYHPLVHWLGRRLRLEQEIAADELAAKVFGRREQYAAILAGLALGKPQPAAIVGLGLFMSRPFLMRRISMLRKATEHRRPSRLVRVSSVLLLTASAIAIAGLRATPAASGADETPGDGSSSAAPDDAAKSPPVSGETSQEVLSDEDSTGVLTIVGDQNARTAPPVSSNPYEPAPAPRYVTALIQISRHPLTLVSNDDGRLDSDTEWQVYCRTQLAILQSLIPLQTALRDPKIAKLPVIKSQADPLRWLSDNLQAGFIGSSEIMSVQLNTKLGDAKELAKVVDAVVHAYMKDVVGGEHERRMAARDAMARSFSRMNEEIRDKMEHNYSLAKELGVSDGSMRDATSELLLREITDATRHKRELEQKLAELNTEFEIAMQTVGESRSKKDFAPIRREHAIRTGILNQQIADLSKSIAETSDDFIERGQESVELKVRQAELEQLQKIAGEMSIQLEKMDIEFSLPDRVRVIQEAM